jgi:spore coat polysaccharide biosynthesis predicted glycosyltransferase SpsG
MTVWIRADIGREIGMGHSVRMKALADEIEKLDDSIPIRFITKTSALRAMVDPFQCITLMEDASESARMHQLGRTANTGDIIVVDLKHYLEPNIFVDLRKQFKVVRIDDPAAERDTFDLLILPGAHYTPQELDELFKNNDENLIEYGWDWVILRNDVTKHKIPVGWRKRDNELKILTGGGDGTMLPQLIEMTRDLPEDIRRVGCLSTQSHPFIIQNLGTNVYITGYDHYSHVARAKLMVVPFGVTVYEAIYAASPVITIPRTRSDADRMSTLRSATSGAVVGTSFIDQLSAGELCSTIQARWEHREGQHLYDSHNSLKKLIDGRGAKRLSERIVEMCEVEDAVLHDNC